MAWAALSCWRLRRAKAKYAGTLSATKGTSAQVTEVEKGAAKTATVMTTPEMIAMMVRGHPALTTGAAKRR